MSTSASSSAPLGLAGLERLLDRLQATAPPFYATAATRLGTGAASERLGRLPVTERAALLDDQRRHLPLGSRTLPDAGFPIRVGKTGSGDDLLVSSWTANDLAVEVAAGTRVFGRLGIVAGMRVANALPGALVTPGALLLGDVVEAIGALDVPLGLLDTPAAAKGAWELLDRVEPSVIVLNETSATHLFAAMPPGARPWWKGIVWLRSDEVAAADRPVPPPAFTGWQKTWLAVPDAASFVAHEVAPGRFQLDDGVYGEAVGGRLVLTTLARDAALVRYRTGVAVHSVDAATATITLA